MVKWLTNRDKEVLKAIYFHRFITTKQLTELFFRYHFNEEGKRVGINKYPNVIARRRIKKYRENKLIKSFYPAYNQDMIHSIDEKGLMIVAGLLGTTFNKLYFNKREDILSYGLAQHAIKLNDLYIKLLRESERLGGEIIKFQVERLNLTIFEYKDKKYRFQPDAFMIYKPNKNVNKVRMYYIELDNDTESPKRYAQKVEEYESYYNTKEFQRIYKTFPKIITVTTTPGRIERLKRAAKTKLDWDYVLFKEAEKILKL
ncbi:MAG: replication-relaxation family protein [Thermosipho sp. (in: Bacteria)]|nr:replication-relaxation family protein [Thermosipho sp. (in: thermotogales)]